MVRLIEFSSRFTTQLHKILTFYDKRNGSDDYSRHLLRCLMEDIDRIAIMPTASSPSTRTDVRFIYVLDFVVVFRYTSKKLIILSIRSTSQKPMKLYIKR